MIGLLFGERLIVGIEDDPDGSLRVYVDARHTGIHTHIDDESAKEQVRNAWASSVHLTAPIPREALCDCEPEGADR